MKEKKKYITPTSELIKIVSEKPLAGISRYGLNRNNWMMDKSRQREMDDHLGHHNDLGEAPTTWGDYRVDPGGDIDIGAKVNPWGSWDE